MSDAVVEAVDEVDAFCASRVPPDLREQIRLETWRRGNAITIVERRPPWRPDLGREWTSSEIARLRFDPATSSWTLHWKDSGDRWHVYDGLSPSDDVSRLLAEIDADPTGIFWG